MATSGLHFIRAFCVLAATLSPVLIWQSFKLHPSPTLVNEVNDLDDQEDDDVSRAAPPPPIESFFFAVEEMEKFSLSRRAGSYRQSAPRP